MKKNILFVLLLVVSTNAFSQQTNPSQKISGENYLKKSKNQKTAAWVLLGGGVALITTAFAVGMNDAAEDLAGILFLGEEQQSSNTGEVLFYTGLVSMAGSIPLFIASSKNKRKAEKIAVVLKMEKLTCFQYQLVKQISYPALTVKFSL
jgi:phosphate/sulfate permease